MKLYVSNNKGVLNDTSFYFQNILNEKKLKLEIILQLFHYPFNVLVKIYQKKVCISFSILHRI